MAALPHKEISANSLEKTSYHSGGPGGREKVSLGKAEPDTELNTTPATFACEKRRHFAFPLILPNSCFLGKWHDYAVPFGNLIRNGRFYTFDNLSAHYRVIYIHLVLVL